MGSNNLLKDVLFIEPEQGFYYPFIKSDGLNIVSPYKGGKSLFLRIFRELHFRLNLPCKYVWYNSKTINKYSTFFVFEELLITDFLKWLYQKDPDRLIVLFYANICKPFNHADMFDDKWCIKWSGDPEDCTMYRMNMCTESTSFFKSWHIVKRNPDIDVFYIGRDKGRLDYLLGLEKNLRDLGLNPYFHIASGVKYTIKRDHHYKSLIPYSKVLEYLSHSRAILHLEQGAQACITIRLQESLVNRIKLITDSKDIKKYKFYDPDNIFILGEDDISTLPRFLDKPYKEVNLEELGDLYFENLATRIIEQSIEIKRNREGNR
ncbi:MAG: hypothetical protein PHG06_03675 [Parabacteroides sp.]|nr:hypothetical protein [Parabacteroides sp.]